MEIHKLEVAISELTNPNFSMLIKLWDALRGHAFAPAWRDIDLSSFPGDIIPYITVADLLEHEPTVLYRFWGTGHTRVKGIDLTGKSPLAATPPVVGQIIFQEYLQVRDKRVPMAFIHDIRPQSDTSSRFQETLRLPLSNDGHTVTNVLSLADWQTNQDYWVKMYGQIMRDAASEVRL